jgi:hypothetical protein
MPVSDAAFKSNDCAALERPRFLFVVACPRSGTTMLRAMLDTHPDVAVPPESRFLQRLLRKPDMRLDDPKLVLREIEADETFQAWHLAPEVIDRIRRRTEACSLAEVVSAVYEAYARGRGKTRYADKTPGNLFIMEAIADLIPEACFVHLVRDGRNVVSSWVATSFGPETLLAGAERWRGQVLAARAAGFRLGWSRYFEVRYRDLTEKPADWLRHICDFADIDFREEMIDFYKDPERILASVRHPQFHQGIRRPPTPNLRDWRRDLSRRDVRLFEAVAGDALSAYGFERMTEEPRLDIELELRARRIAKRLRGRFYGLTARVSRLAPRSRPTPPPIATT